MGAATTTRQSLLDLAATQHGLFSSAQAHAAGMGDGALKAWARSGGVARWGHGVWSVAGVPDTEERRAMGSRGRRIVTERFGWPAIARRMLSVYRWLAGQAGEPDCVRRS